MIAATIHAIATTISDPLIATIYEKPPVSLNTADLPAVVIMHSGGEYSWQATGLRKRITRYTLHIIVEPVAQSRMPERISTAQSVYAVVIDKLIGDPTLGGHADHTRNIRDDNGYQVVEWSGVDYFAYTITLEVVEKL